MGGDSGIGWGYLTDHCGVVKGLRRISHFCFSPMSSCLAERAAAQRGRGAAGEEDLKDGGEACLGVGGGDACLGTGGSPAPGGTTDGPPSRSTTIPHAPQQVGKHDLHAPPAEKPEEAEGGFDYIFQEYLNADSAEDVRPGRLLPPEKSEEPQHAVARKDPPRSSTASLPSEGDPSSQLQTTAALSSSGVLVAETAGAEEFAEGPSVGRGASSGLNDLFQEYFQEDVRDTGPPRFSQIFLPLYHKA